MSNFDNRKFSELSESEQSNVRLLVYILTFCSFGGLGLVALLILMILEV